MSRFPKTLAAMAALMLIASPLAAKKLGLGREAHPDEVKAWDIDVRPDGAGLPAGKGSVQEGEALFLERCAACHGEFGEGAGRWPPVAGGHGSLGKESPEKTIGSFWPFASTAFDYVRRTMPFGDAQSLTPDEVYALIAFILNMNDVVEDDFVLSKENFASIKLPNEKGFRDDDRQTAEKHFWRKDVCTKNCKAEVKIIGRARVLDVTPEDAKKGPKVD
jgi:cytochrome c